MLVLVRSTQPNPTPSPQPRTAAGKYSRLDTEAILNRYLARHPWLLEESGELDLWRRVDLMASVPPRKS